MKPKNKGRFRLFHLLVNFSLLLCATPVKAQDSLKFSNITISAYAEMYYCYDFSKPSNHQLPSFFYSFNRHNEVNLNMGYIKARYAQEKVRANLALMAGTYAQYNMAEEQSLLRTIFEANAGIKISKKTNTWIDAGIMPSHIGFESAIGKDCANLTRSLMAENSPYYEAGVKINHTSKNEKWYLAGLYLNGWQRIQRTPGNQSPSLGTQLTFLPGKKLTLNWSTFMGNDLPDSVRVWRFYNDFYVRYQASTRLMLLFGFDIGFQQASKASTSYNQWHTPVFIMQYKMSPDFTIAARAEYYADAKNVIIYTGRQGGFYTAGWSLNLDYQPVKNLTWRLEGRSLRNNREIFMVNNRPARTNYFITTSVAVSF